MRSLERNHLFMLTFKEGGGGGEEEIPQESSEDLPSFLPESQTVIDISSPSFWTRGCTKIQFDGMASSRQRRLELDSLFGFLSSILVDRRMFQSFKLTQS